MSDNNEELFDGLQIMSPEELNSAVQAKEGDSENANISEGESEEFVLKPVEAETGDDATTRESKETYVKQPTTDSNENRSETVYKALLKELVKEGVITAEEAELDQLPGNFDTIKSLLNKTVETHFKNKEENWKRSLSPEKKKFLEIEDAFDETDYAILMAQRLELLS